jgi:hypothetical protein
MVDIHLRKIMHSVLWKKGGKEDQDELDVKGWTQQ